MTTQGWSLFGDPSVLSVGVKAGRRGGLEVGHFRLCVQGTELADRREVQWTRLPVLHVRHFLREAKAAPAEAWYEAPAHVVLEESYAPSLYEDDEWVPQLGPDTKEYKRRIWDTVLYWHGLDCFRFKQFAGFCDNDNVFLVWGRSSFDGERWHFSNCRKHSIPKVEALKVEAAFFSWFQEQWWEATGEHV